MLPGEMDAFVEWWPRVRDVREQFGFKVLFSFVDESTNQFVWAVQLDDNFDEIDKAYRNSPERAAVFEGVPNRIADSFISKVTVVHQHWD
jgi:hypothetical protein